MSACVFLIAFYRKHVFLLFGNLDSDLFQNVCRKVDIRPTFNGFSHDYFAVPVEQRKRKHKPGNVLTAHVSVKRVRAAFKPARHDDFVLLRLHAHAVFTQRFFIDFHASFEQSFRAYELALVAKNACCGNKESQRASALSAIENRLIVYAFRIVENATLALAIFCFCICAYSHDVAVLLHFDSESFYAIQSGKHIFTAGDALHFAFSACQSARNQKSVRNAFRRWRDSCADRFGFFDFNSHFCCFYAVFMRIFRYFY